MPVNKKKGADLRRQYPIYIQLGLAGSLVFLIAAFRVDYQPQSDPAFTVDDQPSITMIDIPQTEHIKKLPPPPRPPLPVERPDDEVLDDVDFKLDVALDLETEMEILAPPDLFEEEEEEARSEPFITVEEMPELIGGLAAVQRLITYPEIAKKAGVEGRVFVQFIVDVNGNVVDPVVTRGIGAGCDEEAVRAIRQARFTPGKQRGQAVPVKMSLPITFRLR